MEWVKDDVKKKNISHPSRNTTAILYLKKFIPISIAQF